MPRDVAHRLVGKFKGNSGGKMDRKNRKFEPKRLFVGDCPESSLEHHRKVEPKMVCDAGVYYAAPVVFDQEPEGGNGAHRVEEFEPVDLEILRKNRTIKNK